MHTKFGLLDRTGTFARCFKTSFFFFKAAGSVSALNLNFLRAGVRPSPSSGSSPLSLLQAAHVHRPRHEGHGHTANGFFCWSGKLSP